MAWSPTDLPSDFAWVQGAPPVWSVREGRLPSAAAAAAPEQLLAAWFAVFHQHTGETGLVVGTPRPTRVVLDPDGTFADLVGLVTAAQAAPATDVMGEPRIWFGPRAAAAPAGQLAVGILDESVRIEYDASLFEAATIDRLIAHYRMLLDRALAGGQALLRTLMSASEPNHARSPEDPGPATSASGHDLGAAPPGGQTLVGRFRAVASRHPEQLAIRGSGGSYTYRELDEASDALAGRLLTVAGPGEMVALLCGHDTGAVVAVWAVLKAGAACVPLDPRQPTARLKQILAGAGPAAIVCDPDLGDTADGLAGGRPVIRLDGRRHHGPRPPEGTGDRLDGLAYVVHTSGSTGRPKGVRQSGRNVLAHALSFAGSMEIGPGNRLPTVARIAYDAGVLDMFGALLCGASLHIVDPYTSGPDNLLATLTEHQVTLLHCTPTLLRHLIGQLNQGVPRPALRWVALGGEEVIGTDVAGVTRCFPGAKVLNQYGPSECSIALQHVAAPSDARRSSVPLGRRVSGIDVRLVDTAGEPAAVFGEVVLAGAGIALGYLGQPESTAQAFGIGSDGVRYYRTGDLARRRPDGTLVFCGRLDSQLKIRGYRVEPAEVEAMLRAHLTVRQAAVVADRGAGNDIRLIGYVTSPGPLGASPAELLEYLRRVLPDYAVPAVIVVLKKLPVGPTGKLDRSLLPAPREETPGAEGAPRSALERRLAEIWCQTLSRTTAGIHDNFFASGGDSIRIMKLLDSINGEFGVIVPLPAFLTSPTLETLARHVAVTHDAARPGVGDPKTNVHA